MENKWITRLPRLPRGPFSPCGPAIMRKVSERKIILIDFMQIIPICLPGGPSGPASPFSPGGPAGPI